MKIYVSLTSIFGNQESLFHTLKSIKTQSLLPDKCYVYLSTDKYLLDEGFKDKIITNKDITKFIDDNDLFIIKWVDNTGPYRKLLPLLKEKWDEDCLIITIDDDTVYHPDLIKNFSEDYNKHKCCITYRGYTLKNKPIRQLSYTITTLVQTNLYNFHTGKGGVLIHPTFFHKTKNLIFREDLYRECCPTGDDIWFNFLRIANNLNCFVGSQEYMIKDLTTEYELFGNFNSKNDLNTVNIRKTVSKLIELGYLKEDAVVFDSDKYWDNRYKNGGNSGVGSYNELDNFKAQIINEFIQENSINSMIDYGVGDGNQLKLFNTKNIKYVGLDVSTTIIDKCNELFKNDVTKEFYHMDNFNTATNTADVVLSCDVLYHLIDDNIYYSYLKTLFEMSNKYVIIYAPNENKNEGTHVKKRKFVEFINNNYKEFELIDNIKRDIGCPFWIYQHKKTICKSNVPTVIFQTSKDLLPNYVKDMIMSKCIGWNYKHFLDADIITFFKENPLDEFPDTINIFNNFKSGEHKADLFRYYYLYLNGGVFIDSDIMIERQIERIIKHYEFVSVKSYYSNKNLIFNGFIACTPKHSIIYEALKDTYNISTNDLNKDYHLICKNLYLIYDKLKTDKTYLLVEHINLNFKEGIKSFNRYDNHMLTHYCTSKIIPNPNTLDQIIINWNSYIEKKLIPLIGNSPEGNIYSRHLSTEKTSLMIPKQKNIVNFIKKINPKNVLEIGFNAGFSTLLMKMTNSSINMTCVDINDHNYVIPCYKYLCNDFDNIELITKSSLVALPELIEVGKKYDVIHIDGDHRIEGATKDFELCLKLSKKGTVIIFDDTNLVPLNNLCNNYVNNNIVKEYLFNKIEGTYYNHRFLEVI